MTTSEKRPPSWNPLEAHVFESVRAKLFEQPADPVRIGRFELLGRLGQGGMGVVFAARDPHLDRRVAIKMLHSNGPDDVQRLLREAKAMAQLSHPHVVTVYEAGNAHDQVYLAMELIEGEDLRRWSARGPHSWREVLARLVQAARGLAALHAAGLVHRDFKPENVMITANGVAKVADFGLARTATDLPSADGPFDRSNADPALGLHTITQGGGIVGTPAYAAPEVLQGGRADPRSDQFGFCVTAHEALFGERPFAGKSLHALVENMTHRRISAVPEDSLVPVRVRRLIARGLAADPDARHPSMAELAEALAVSLARRRRATTGIAAIGLLGIGVAAVWPRGEQECTGSDSAWAIAWDDTRRATVRDTMNATGHPGAAATFERVATQLDTYGEAWTRQYREACGANASGEQSDAILDARMTCLVGRRDRARALVDALEQADAARVERAVEAAKRLPELDICDDPDALAREEPLPADPDLRAQILDLYGQRQQALVMDSLGQIREAEAAYESIRAAADALGHGPLQALVRTDLARRGFATAAVRDMLHDAVFFAEGAGYDEAARIAWTRLVQTHAYLTEYEASARAIRHAEAIIERLGHRPEHLAALAESTGFMQLEMGDLDAAVREFRSGLEILESLDPDHPDYPDLGRFLGNLGTGLTLKGEDEEALVVYERAYEHDVRMLGSMHRSVGHDLMNLGRVVSHLDRLDESNDYYERSIALFDALGASDDGIAILALNNLGQNYGDQGHYPEAIAKVQEAIAAMERTVGPEHRKLVRMRRGLAEIYLDARDMPRAVDEARRALAVSIAAFGDDHPETSATRRRLGRVLVADGGLEEAVTLLERAMQDELAKSVPPVQLANTKFWLAAALQHDPRTHERARQLAEEAIPAMLKGEPKERRRVDEIRKWLADGGTLGREDAR